jgi:hypothetical protein
MQLLTLKIFTIGLALHSMLCASVVVSKVPTAVFVRLERAWMKKPLMVLPLSASMVTIIFEFWINFSKF